MLVDIDLLRLELFLLLQRHDIQSGLLVIPRPDGEFALVPLRFENEMLRQLGTLLVKHLKDERGPLN